MTMIWSHRDGTVRTRSMNSKSSSVNEIRNDQTSIETEQDDSLRKTVVVSTSIQNLLKSFSEKIQKDETDMRKKEKPSDYVILSALSRILSKNDTSQTLASLIHSIRCSTKNRHVFSHDILRAMRTKEDEFILSVLHCVLVSNSFLSSSSCDCASVLRDKHTDADTVLLPRELLEWKCEQVSCILDHMITIKKKVTTSTSSVLNEEEEDEVSSSYMAVAKKFW